MSHAILIKALEFVAARDYSSGDRPHTQCYIFTFLTTQRQLFNCLAPILPREYRLIQPSPEQVLRLLMRADTFRFATSVVFGSGMTTAWAQEVLSKMDCVIHVQIDSLSIDDAFTPTLMALPHLEQVTFSERGRNVTYHGTLRPLLKHPQESVRRSVAASIAASAMSWWFQQLSTEEVIQAIRDIIIPLIDSASCNGAVQNYLQLVGALARYWREFTRDIIVMLGERLFQFFTATTSHSALIDKSLHLLSELAFASIRRNTDGPAPFHLLVDVFKEWPVLELLPEMIQRGMLIPHGRGVEFVIVNIFYNSSTAAASQPMMHHRRRFFELQIVDIMYDSYFAQTGESPFAIRCGFRDRMSVLAHADPVQLLTKTSVFKRELERFLLPWHREAMSRMLSFTRRGENGELLVAFGDLNCGRRTDAARFIIEVLLCPMVERERGNQNVAIEMSQVLGLLFDENELNIGPVLRSFLILGRNCWVRGRHPSSLSSRRVGGVYGLVCRCRAAGNLERDECIEMRRRGREGDEATAGRLRSYMLEFLDSFTL